MDTDAYMTSTMHPTNSYVKKKKMMKKMLSLSFTHFSKQMNTLTRYRPLPQLTVVLILLSIVAWIQLDANLFSTYWN